jgi:predicted acetyltransferase
MLVESRHWALALGIDPALVTCDVDNVGSIGVIEAAGGVLEDVRGIKRRYWVPTS